MLKGVFFDLDGTLLPMEEDHFTQVYFQELCKKAALYGYNPQELTQVVWGGVKQMYQNQGTLTNEEVFWTHFKKSYSEEKIKDKKIFDSFYVHEFKNTKSSCEENPLAKEIVQFVRNEHLLSILSTNPIFPYQGTLTRMNFIGLKEEDFDYITAYENSYYCKPNPKYFESLLKQFALKPEEVIVFGNNDVEDYLCAKQCHIKCYLVGKHLILHPEQKLNAPMISMEEIIPTIKNHLKEGLL